MSRILEVLRSPWALLVAAVVVVLLVVHDCNRGNEAERELARRDEAARLEADGLLVAARTQRAVLEGEIAKLSAELQAEVERARRAGARPTAAAHVSTGGVATAPPAPGAERTCLLWEGDVGEVAVEQVTLETKAGNRLLVGTGTAYRVKPLPQIKLFGGPFQADVSGFVETPPPAKPAGRWGAGPWVGFSQDGLAYGLALSPPAAFGGRIEVVAGAGVGPGGFAASAAALGRF